ncbi:unnamed protein product [Cuscuta campestris]|uniref:Uncharacterized protein n=1 Tax=Cuscuta campestris TaxID=132261 RepID=A0A484L1S5_9ASTE|nr:unnamed protein product [Cuscuta campestris]
MDLPAGFRQAYEMGLVSSVQMVKFLAINARPTTARFISRSIPQGLSRGFIGRLLELLQFSRLMQKMLQHDAATHCSGSKLYMLRNPNSLGYLWIKIKEVEFKPTSTLLLLLGLY